MKTPREILLERHQAAAPKLDAIRQSAVAAVCDRRISNERRSQTTATMILKTFWLELVWPCRRIWAGLAAVWILIFAANFSLRDNSPVAVAKSSPTPEMIMSFQQQEKVLAELLGSNEPRVAEKPKVISPQPRSERRMETLTA